MKTVFFDTNVMIDIIGRRQQFCRPSLQIMSLADRGILRVCVSAMSYATASFILSRDNKQMDIVGEFAKFAKITTTTPVDADTIDDSNRSEFDDFEDAMLYCHAQQEGLQGSAGSCLRAAGVHRLFVKRINLFVILRKNRNDED